MKTVFIINPAAGQGNNLKKLIEKVNNLTDVEKEFYITKGIGNATRFVKD